MCRFTANGLALINAQRVPFFLPLAVMAKKTSLERRELRVAPDYSV